jgi:hypothetical protein
LAVAAKVNGARVTCLFLEEPRIVAAHELEATGAVGFDPAVDVFEPFRQRSALLAQAP